MYCDTLIKHINGFSFFDEIGKFKFIVFGMKLFRKFKF